MNLLLIFLCFTIVVCAVEERGYFSLYDCRDDKFNRNSLNFDSFEESFTKNGFYKFDFFTSVQDYDEKPVLMVYQPDDNVNELHGYFFKDGVHSLFYRSHKNNPTYKTIRDLFDGTTEAVTPFAAKTAYPYFYDYPMVKINNTEGASSSFAVMFVAPKNRRIKGADTDYIEIIRNNFYKDPFETYEHLYLTYGKDFCPYLKGNTEGLCALRRKRRK